MEEQKQIKDYIVDYLLDGEDEKHLDPILVEWLAESESHRKEFDLYKKIWKESHRYTESEAFDPDLAWEKVNKINRQKIYAHKYWKNILYIVSGAAASLLIMLALSFMGAFEKSSDMQVRMSADYGSRSEIVLPRLSFRTSFHARISPFSLASSPMNSKAEFCVPPFLPAG